jgi:hypothetical protein
VVKHPEDFVHGLLMLLFSYQPSMRCAHNAIMKMVSGRTMCSLALLLMPSGCSLFPVPCALFSR